MSSHLKGILFVSIGALFWGGSGVAAQYVLQVKGFSPSWLVCARMIAAGFLLLLADMVQHPHSLLSVWKSKKDRQELLLFAFCGMLGVQYTYFTAIYYGNAAAASVLQYLMPVLVVIWGALRARALPTIKEVLCVLLAIAGAFLLVTRGDLSSLAVPPLAIFWGVLSAFGAAFYTVQPKRLLITFRSPLVIGWAMLLGGLMLFPLHPLWHFIGTMDIAAAFVFAYIIIFGTVLAFWFYLESIKYLPPAEISALASIEPLSAVLLSTVLLTVPFGPIETVGAALILSTVFILARR